MHMIGMAAMRIAASMSFDPGLVALAVGFGVAAASVALWLAFNLRGLRERLVASCVLGVAVCGLHYLTMAGTTFRFEAGAQARSLVTVPPGVFAYTVFLIAALNFVVALTIADSPGKGLVRRLKRLGWRRPATVAMLLALVTAVPIGAGWWAHAALDAALKQRVTDDLETVLRADVTALEIWLEKQRAAVEVAAAEPEVAALMTEFIDRRRTALQDPAAEVLERLSGHYRTVVEAYDFERVVAIDPKGPRLLARDFATSGALTGSALEFVTQVLRGEATVSRPLRATWLGQRSADVLSPLRMYAAAPIRDSGGTVLGGLAFEIDPQAEFVRILTAARSGRSGETYAFDHTGVAISPSRFDDQLRALGLIPATDGAQGTLALQIRDPGGNLLAGFRPPVARADQPLTYMAQEAVAGRAGVDVDGYRDYRGVPVVGAWAWLDDYGFGLATEVDVTEAFGRLGQLRRGLWALLGLLATAAVGNLLSHRIIGRLQHRVARAQRLGQYTLEKSIGTGGMGVVYRANHALLRRPTAVKLLKSEAADEQSIARFEREVQLTSKLTHPNTIAIYDFGRTPDGMFYYAMEYLPGQTLAALIEIYGAQPENRVVHILRQVCGSLSEAHGVGLIHRDIKPSNIMLCQRGGLLDVVKVLDFGLVKERTTAIGAADTKLTMDGTFTGTPNYVSPEGIRSPGEVDGRADLYCLGAVGYYLLTGQHVFASESAIEVLSQHLSAKPEPPSTRVGAPVSPDLERLILQCLEKEPSDRPASAQGLLDALTLCANGDPWNQVMARRWWDDHAAPDVLPPSEAPTVSSGFEHQALEVDLHQRVQSGDRSSPL